MRIGIVLALTVMTAGCGFSARNSPGDAHDAGMGSDAAIATGRQQMEIVAGAGQKGAVTVSTGGSSSGSSAASPAFLVALMTLTVRFGATSAFGT